MEIRHKPLNFESLRHLVMMSVKSNKPTKNDTTQRKVGPKIPSNIYDPAFIRSERSDPRFTVVFDLDDTLVTDYEGQILVRPHVKSTIEKIKEMGIKIVIWTGAGIKRAVKALKAVGIYEICDVIIAGEAWSDTADVEELAETLFQSEKERELILNYTLAKNINLLGYDILVDNDSQEISSARKWGCKCIEIYSFVIIDGEDPKGVIREDDFFLDLYETIRREALKRKLLDPALKK
jgi:hypothetical protein